MKIGQIATHLADVNPWWREPVNWQRDDTNLRFATAAPFHYRSGALRALLPGGLYVLRGPRRAGKSTEIKYAIADLIDQGVPPRNIIHAAVDEWRAADLRTLVRTASQTFLAGGAGTRYWFLDEVSSIADDWPATIKNLRDTDPEFATDTVVLTGSSAAQLHRVRKAFAGRRGEVTNTDRTLLPMRFTDVVAATGLKIPSLEISRIRDLHNKDVQDQIADLLPYLADLVSLWEAYLRVGGFPQAVASWLKNGDVEEWVVNALWDVVFGDAINGARLSASQTLSILEKLARNLCSPLNATDLAREIDISRDTLRGRLADLTESFLVWPCYREQGLTARLMSQTKWYFTDPLLSRIASLRGRGQEPDFTQLTQQQIGVALLRNLDSFGIDSAMNYDQILHYRSASRAEIDFVGRDLGDVAVKSKYTDGRWGRDMQTIAASPWFGIVASRSGVEYMEEGWVIPAPLLALLLGA